MTGHPLIAEICRRAPVITDGAWGTQLQDRGLPRGEVPDLWNLTHPNDVAAVAHDYVEAGSAIVLTNTFGANRVRLQHGGGADQVKEINRMGVALSRQGADGKALVFASIGPCGKLIRGGGISPDEVLAAFTEQAEALASAKPDGLVVETMADLDEAALAIAAARSTGLPVVASMVFDSGREKDRTMMGVTPEQAVEALIKAGADVVGANCGRGIEGFVVICQRMKAVAGSVPVWIKANAGLPTLIDGNAVYTTTAAEFACSVPAVLAAGASFIGGCCGTSPEFIREARRVIGDARPG
jgi:5-methyltetrahydrofolate--homocysteine methyltransferase